VKGMFGFIQWIVKTTVGSDKEGFLMLELFSKAE